MGIHGLMKLLSEECPHAIREQEMDNLAGRKVAIDASMAMYQFLIAVRSSGPGGAQASMMLTNEAGEVTSHIQGMFNRTIKMLERGVKPAYIFDGKPPELKGGELAKRMAKRAKAESDLAAAKESGDTDDVDKFSRRLVKVTRQHNEDCKELLRLMGVPVIDAPCEAEAQCAELAKKGKVYATATEDMDALTFRTPKLLRKLTFAQGKDKQPILEIDCETILSGLGLTYEQFVDLCILCGCDYCSSIKSVGPKTALKLIRQYGSLEKIVAALKHDKKISLSADWLSVRVRKVDLENPSKSSTTDIDGLNEELNNTEEGAEGEKTEEQKDKGEGSEIDIDEEENEIDVDLLTTLTNNEQQFSAEGQGGGDDDVVLEEDDDLFIVFPPMYQQARKLFIDAPVLAAEEIELKWTEPDEAGLRQFLVEKMGFNAERVNTGIKKLQDAQKKKAQKRMDSFFQPVSTTNSTAVKRKAVEPAKGKAAAKSSKSFGGKKR